jgi:HK97 family phage major capsid protein
VQGWCRAQLGLDIDDRHRRAAKSAGVKLNRKELELGLARNHRQVKSNWRNAMSLTAAAGGYTVPEGFMSSLERAMLMYGPMLDVSDVIRTETGNSMPWPTANDTGNTGELLAEGTSIGSSVDPTIGVKTLGAYKFSSKLVLISAELLMDSAFQLATVLGEMLGERLGRVQNTYFTTGTGSSQPAGIVTGSTNGKTTASATAITLDEMLDLIYSVDRAYRAQSSFMAHDNIWLALRKLKDTTNQYLWQPSVQAGQPDRFSNYPVMSNNDMASTIATTNKTVLFGQMSKYKVRQVAQLRLRRLVERYADTDQEGFVAFQRADGVLLDAGVAPVKRITQL